MSEANGLAPEMETAVVSWWHGCMVHGRAAEGCSKDAALIVRTPKVVGGHRSALLSVHLDPVLTTVEALDGRRVEVQTFRCRWFDGLTRLVTVCTCGDVAFCDAVDLAGWAVVGCRNCGRELSTCDYTAGRCPEWHAFGSCLRCPVSVAPGSGGVPPPAGPAGPSHGPVPGPLDSGKASI